jgi:hypothetical protein
MQTLQSVLDPETRDFYVRSLAALKASRVPFLVGGAYAMASLAGVERHTKDLDVFICKDDRDRILVVLEVAGFQTEIPYLHWLAQGHGDAGFIDVIYSSGNGVARVDQAWFDHSQAGEILHMPVQLCPTEEMIWSKSFVQERERFDGADVIHLLRARGEAIDWNRLLRRFGPHWRILFGHIVFFGFAYPSERHKVPGWVLEELVGRLVGEKELKRAKKHVCQGTLLSRTQYLIDIGLWGYEDGRLHPTKSMTPEEIATWTAAIDPKA